MSQSTANELIPPELLAAASQLSVDARPVPPAMRAGLHNSRAAGVSLDFRDFRPYTAGDDLRRVDWSVYQRTGQLFLRRFEHPTTTAIHLLIDNSESMFVESPARYFAAAQVAAAIAVAAIGSQDMVSVSAFAAGPSMSAPIRSATGRSGTHAVLAYLASVQPANPASLRDVVGPFVRSRPAAGAAVILSDFFDLEGTDVLIEQLAIAGNAAGRLVLVQITQPWDAHPQLDEALELVDCESGAITTVTASASAIGAYQAAYAAHQARLDQFASQRGALLVRIDASEPIIPQLVKLFPSGVLRLGSGGAR